MGAIEGKLAKDIRLGEVVIFHAQNGRTLARVTGFEAGVDAEVWGVSIGEPRPLIGLRVYLKRAVKVPCESRWFTSYWTLWHRPDDIVEIMVGK